MNDKQKLEVLRNQETEKLITDLHEAEANLEKALFEESSFKNLNFEYLASGTNDCQAVKGIIAELSTKIPEVIEIQQKLTQTDKKAWLKSLQEKNPEFKGTIADAPETVSGSKALTDMDKKAWLERQRTENEDLHAAVSKQRDVSFLIDNNQITSDMAKRKFDGIRAVLAIKTQQLAFLAS